MAERPKVDVKAPTILAPETEQQRTRMPLTGQENPKSVEKIQGDVKAPIKTMIATFLVGGAAAGTLAYNYANNLFPFNKSENRQETVAASPSASAGVNTESASPAKELPQVIRTNEDLRTALEVLHIKATAADFEKDNGNSHLGGLSLEPLNADGALPPEEFQYRWQSMNSNKINGISENEVIIATRRMHPRSGIRYVGLQPRAHTANPDDPTIDYHYYHCDDRSSRELAQISVVMNGKNGTFYSINLTDCGKK